MQDGALADLKVVECGHMVSGPYCAKLLADLGAEVIKVEPPQGDEARRMGPFPSDIPHPERSGLFLYVNTSKMGVTLNLRSATGRKILQELLRGADILVEDNPPRLAKELGLDYEALRQINPRLIMTSVTPFGQSGPYRDYKATDLISYHMGGMGYVTPSGVEDLQGQPPLKAGGRQADFLAGLVAATATMVAVAARWATGRGQRVDVSEQEAVASMMIGDIVRLSYENLVVGRLKNMLASILPCRDGFVSLTASIRPHTWQRLLELMGNPAWAENELFRTPRSRDQYWDGLDPLIRQWSMQHSKNEVYRLAQAKRLSCFPVNNMDDVLASEHLAARGFFVEMDHPEAGRVKYPGAFARLSATPAPPRRAAPMLGQDNEAVFCRGLGYPREDLVKWRETGVI